jgi:hypothetical protein
VLSAEVCCVFLLLLLLLFVLLLLLGLRAWRADMGGVEELA